jgi:hypothetical protein
LLHAWFVVFRDTGGETRIGGNDDRMIEQLHGSFVWSSLWSGSCRMADVMISVESLFLLVPYQGSIVGGSFGNIIRTYVHKNWKILTGI